MVVTLPSFWWCGQQIPNKMYDSTLNGRGIFVIGLLHTVS